MISAVVCTAGHIDHGKTALVRALTGHDTDRLPAERERGITIEPGYAPLRLPDGARVSLVDVPGHERFVRHMIAGAGGVDAALVCVAADDGVMPQTREHLAVLDLLGVEARVVAVTRSDLAPPGPATGDIRALVGGGVAIVPVSAIRGDGLPELVDAVARMVGGVRRRHADGPTRLFVDRAFSVAGAGTVVTGTLWGAGVAVGDRLATAAGGGPFRVRGMQVHDEPVARATSGRVALALAGAAVGDVARGTCLVRPEDRWPPTRILDCAVTLLPDAGTIRSGARVQAFLGTVECPATLVTLEGPALHGGEGGYAQIRLPLEVAARARDRVILRSASRRTIGGAIVVDAAATRHGRGSGVVERIRTLHVGDAAQVAALRLREAGGRGLPASEAGAAGIPLGQVHVDPDVVAGARRAVIAALAEGPVPTATAAAASGLHPGPAASLVDALVAERLVERDGGSVRLPGTAAPDTDGVERVLREAGLDGRTTAQVADATDLDAVEAEARLRHLTNREAAVPLGGLWFHPEALRTAEDLAVRLLGDGPCTLAALRDAWGVGRRTALVLAEHLDARRVTLRRGDLRHLRRRSPPP